MPALAIRPGMRVVSDDGMEIGTVVKAEVFHFVVRETRSQVASRFTYDEAILDGDVVTVPSTQRAR